MRTLDLVIWSMVLGTIAAVALVRFADSLFRSSPSQWQGVAYHCTVFLLVFLLSGVAAEMLPLLDAGLIQVAQVVSGPVCVGLSDLWIRGWLSASRRDRIMAAGLNLSAVMLPVAGFVCLLLPAEQQLPAAALVALLGSGLTFGLTARAAVLGDRLAPVMAAGCLLTLPAIAGLYANAMHIGGLGAAVQWLLALCTASCNALTGYVLWRRDRHNWRTRTEDARPSGFDPVTKLYSAINLVQKIVRAQRRRGRSRRDGAVIAVMVFDTDHVLAQVGTAGLNELFIRMGVRIQRQVGVVNPVGRYYDRCFVSLVETIHSPAWLRTLGLRTAASVRRPIEVGTPEGGRVEIRADVGVGVVHLSSGQAAVEDILHDAQRLAEAARGMGSRAAILDPSSGDAIAVEHANLGPRRHAHMHLLRHAL